MRLSRIFCVFLIFVIFITLSHAVISFARMDVDLKLDQTKAMKIVVTPQPNPHDTMECGECHQTEPLSPKEAKETPALSKDEYIELLCLKCHQGDCFLHPSDIDPVQTDLHMNIPDIFPLKFVYEGLQKIICMTCHDIHYPHTRYKLLRGYSLNPDIHPSRFTTRLDFCKGCHGEELDLLSPHKDHPVKPRCTFCHVSKPSEEKHQPLNFAINSICTNCHPVYPSPHFLEFNPFPDLTNQEIFGSGLPVSRGYTCITCHLSHGQAGTPSYLRKEFIQLVRTSTRVNPHEKFSLCLNCHPEVPPPGTPGIVVELITSDITALCNNCHDTGEITGMNHPLQNTENMSNTPKDWPLSPDGKLTCTTCHQPGHALIQLDNPRFLRGGPYNDIRVICSKCHEAKKWSKVNPHEDYFADKGCEICHLPDIPQADGTMKTGPTKADGNFLCLRCHETIPHPASHRHRVKPGVYEYVHIDRDTFHLDRFGRITCYTCHQIHQKDNTAFYFPSPYNLFSVTICRGCHPF